MNNNNMFIELVETTEKANVEPFGWESWETYAAGLIFLWLWGILGDIDFLKKLTPCGKPTAALFSAGLMVTLGILQPSEALECIEMGTILLLFGLFVILEFLETLGVVDVLTSVILKGAPSPLMILVRISLMSGGMAAFVMNDGAAIFLSKVVLEVCDREHLPRTPYMLVLATSANIGSSSTVLGNPKNMVIHSNAGLSFTEFAISMVPPALVCLFANTLFAVIVYYAELNQLSQPYMRRKRKEHDLANLVSALSESQQLLKRKQGGFSTDTMGTSSSSDSDTDSHDSHDSDNLEKLELNREASLIIQRKKRQLPTIIREKMLYHHKESPSSMVHRHESPSVIKRYLRSSSISRTHAPKLSVVSEVDYGTMNNNDEHHISFEDEDKQSLSYVPKPSSLHTGHLKPLNFAENLNFEALRKAWAEYHPASLTEEDEYIPADNKGKKSIFTLPMKAVSSMINTVTGIDNLKKNIIVDAGDIDELKPKSKIIGYYTGINVFINIILMYGLFLMPNSSLGWSCVMCAMSILIFQHTPPEHIYSKLNFTLLFYIIALFVTIGGINKTPLASTFWSMIEPIILSDSVPIATVGFCLLVFIICLVFTSIPCVLIIAPHLHQLTGELHHVSWLLLALCVTLCGNITPTSSIAGYIVSDCVSKSDPLNPITTWTWMRFSFPSVIICVAVGASVLVMNAV